MNILRGLFLYNDVVFFMVQESFYIQGNVNTMRVLCNSGHLTYTQLFYMHCLQDYLVSSCCL